MPTTKRRGKNRSYQERIADLETKIAEQKQRLQDRKQRAKQKKELSPVAKEIPRIAKRLQAFAQLAVDSGRLDIANSVGLFLAGLHRVHQEEIDEKQGPRLAEVVEDEVFEEEYGPVRARGTRG